MTDAVDVDRIWVALGRWGWYQIRQLIVLLVAIWSCGFHVLSIVFIGFKPDFLCKDVATNQSIAWNDSLLVGNLSHNVSREFGQCSIKTITNASGIVTVEETGCTDGWAYPEFEKDRSFATEWDLVCERQEFAEVSQTLVMVGQAFGAFIFTSLSDRFGRKPVHILCHVVLFGVTMATAFVPNYPTFAVMRILTGAFQQGTGLTIAILNLEMFPKEIRGYMEVMGLLFWTTGIALITPIAYILRSFSWRYLQICLAALSAWSIAQWWMIDESLRWLIANHRMAEAKVLIKKACRVNKKNYEDVLASSGFREYEMKCELDKAVNRELLPVPADSKPLVKVTEEGHVENGALRDQNGTSENKPLTNQDALRTKEAPIKKYSVIDLIRSKRLFVTSLIMWFAWITNSMTYYGIMLISSSLAGNRFLNFFLGSIVEYPAALLEGIMINRYGRKLTCITFHSTAGLALIIATICTTLSNGNAALVTAATVFTLIGKFGISGSFSTIFLYTPELYPTNMRNIGIGMSSAAARIGGMLAPYSRNLAEQAVWGPGLVFGIMCAIVVVLTFWVPETNQYELPQTLEECEIWYKENQSRLPGRRSEPARVINVETEEEKK